MIDETVPVTPVTILAISRTADLLVPQPAAHRGVRVMRGGLAATATGELIGWVACAYANADLDCPVWPQQPRGSAFAQLFAGATLTDIVYRGGDWRRASACVNAHLIDRCGLGATRVETEGAERAWHEVSALIAASGQRLRLVS
jgi:hypothetical protein